MKFNVVGFLLASTLCCTTSSSSSVAFTVLSNPRFSQTTSPRSGSGSSSSTTTVLHASRNREKILSRSQWAAARGLSTVVAEKTGTVVGGLLKNDMGLEYVKLVHPTSQSSSEVYLYGGVVTSYIDGQGVEYIAVRPDAKMDGSKPISGGLSHCWPQFGPGKIQQHGFARNVNWSVQSMTDTCVTLQMAPSDYTKAIWDKNFLCTFEVTLEEDHLSTKMIVENKDTDNNSFDFQAALHSYFTVSALENLTIQGSFQGKEFLNKLVNGGTIQTEDRSAITISEEYDRVYMGIKDPVLEDKGTGKKLAVLNNAGWEDTVIWNPYGNTGMGYNNFVCVESVKFQPVTLAAGEKWVGDMALKPSPL